MEKLASIASVMTISVNMENGPWCAPVYFVHNRSFYFFSSPDSIHIIYGLNRKAACSLFIDSKDINDIRGIQMSGSIYEPDIIEKTKAAVKYINKFGKKIGIFDFDPKLIEKKFKSRLYAFLPESYVITDNSKGFGRKNKERWMTNNDI